MVEPKRAPVEPRVFTPGGTCALPLVDEIRALLNEQARGPVSVFGSSRSGKTTALEHLAAILPTDQNIVYLDEPSQAEMQLHLHDGLVVYSTFSGDQNQSCVRNFDLAPWTRDELLEYVIAVHRDRCGSVMSRLPARGSLAFAGLPDIWRLVLDRLANDASIPDAQAALSGFVESVFGHADFATQARLACLESVAMGYDPEKTLKYIFETGSEESYRLLRHREVQLQLAIDHILDELGGNSDCRFLRARLPVELVRGAGVKLTKDNLRLGRLTAFLRGSPAAQAMTSSLLLAADKSWVPERGSLRHLGGALLSGACWPAAELSEANLSEADLSHAQLHGAILDRAQAGSANLQYADLREACLGKLEGTGINLAHSDLAGVHAQGARFVSANLENASFRAAFLKGSDLHGASLIGADFQRADLTEAILRLANLTNADFSGANLTAAVLAGLQLCDARFSGACFHLANLERCNLEEMNLGRVDFRQANLVGALLTGSWAEGADFSGAVLREAGLAEVNWERASLRDADLSGATYHMGTTRSGLVGSPIASEGSRTGFYTDDYEDRCFKAPEEIRKANLRGADLRGAKIDKVDFYLVDLRDALYDSKQRAHFRRCGAILVQPG